MDSCLFQFNIAGPAGSQVKDGIINSLGTSNDVVLKSCTFTNNDFSSPQNGVSVVHKNGAIFLIDVAV